MDISLQRSYLFVPGNRPERFAKACAAGADAVIIDLEDAVPAEDKPAARSSVASWLVERERQRRGSPGVPGEAVVLVRINAADTEWFREDLNLCAAPGAAGIVLPKAERPETIAEARRAGAGLVLPLVESAKGFANAQELAGAPGVGRLVFGSIDFQQDMGITGDGEELLYFRSRLVLVSRLAGIASPVEGVTTAIDDAGLLRSETLRARRLGFGAKLCIHPKQVAVVNEAFMPSADEIAWAERVLAAASAAQGAAVAVDGKMVDRPVILRAQTVLREASKRSE